jgi:hypothetical protein
VIKQNRYFQALASFVQITAADNKKTGVSEHPGGAIEHAGLLVNEPPDTGGLPFI